jgi:diacylglycerol kinase
VHYALQTMQPVNEFKSKSGLKRIFSAFFYSLDGFKAAWRHEHAFRQEQACSSSAPSSPAAAHVRV